jgi:hypothetical protein
MAHIEYKISNRKGNMESKIGGIMKSLFGTARTIVKGRYIIAKRHPLFSREIVDIPIKLVARTPCSSTRCKWKRRQGPCEKCCKFMFIGVRMDKKPKIDRKTGKPRTSSVAGFDMREATEAEMTVYLL